MRPRVGHCPGSILQAPGPFLNCRQPLSAALGSATQAEILPLSSLQRLEARIFRAGHSLLFHPQRLARPGALQNNIVVNAAKGSGFAPRTAARFQAKP